MSIRPAIETTFYIVGMIVCLAILLGGCAISKPAPRIFNQDSLYTPMKFQGKLETEVAELIHPKVSMSECIRQGKQDGMADDAIVTWCLKVAQY